MSDTRYFTLEDVAKHDGTGEAGTWLVIKDVVYDLTNYLDEHPGGGELLMEYAGKDGTSGFDDFGHSSDAKNMLKAWKVGELVEEDRLANRNKKNKIKNQELKTNGDGPRRQTRSNGSHVKPVFCALIGVYLYDTSYICGIPKRIIMHEEARLRPIRPSSMPRATASHITAELKWIEKIVKRVVKNQ